MVKKLLKYEFMSFGRILVPMAIALPSLALLSSLTLLIPSGMSTAGVEVTQALLISLFFIAIVGFCIAAYVVCIVRFHRSVFSKEGYFTLSLPVTPMQLLWAKLLAAFLTVLITFVVALVSVEIFALIHQVDVIGAVLSAIFEFSQVFNSGWIVAYALFYILVGGICGLLFIYACIAAGQLVNKNRTWLSIGCYVVISQIVSTIFSLIQAPVTASFIVNGENTNPAGYLAVIISLGLLQSLILGVGGLFFIRYILRNKVNLQA